MKAKVGRGAGFRGVLAYVARYDAEQVAGNMASAGPRELAAEFGRVRALRPDISKPVWHTCLSLPEGEHLNKTQWNEVATAFMARMGLSDHPWTAFRHTDSGYDHIHLIASRIGVGGQVWYGKHEVRCVIEVAQALERQFGLRGTKGYAEAQANLARTPTKQEIEMALRTGEQLPRLALQTAIKTALVGSPTLPQFMDRLAEQGIDVQLNYSRESGRVSGISFELGGIAFKGSQLGKGYSFNNIQKGLDYEQIRDREAIAKHIDRGRAAGQHHLPGKNISPLRQDVGDRSEPPARSGGCDGTGIGACTGAAATASGYAHDDDATLKKFMRRGEECGRGGRAGGRRVTGSGAVAAARLRQEQAGLVEVRCRLRPVRGAAARLRKALAGASDPTIESGDRFRRDRPADRGRLAPSVPAAQAAPNANRPLGPEKDREFER